MYTYTVRYNIHKFCIQSTMYLRVLLWIWEQTAIISLYIINLPVFITKAENVYCAVRIGSWNKAVCASSVKPTGHVMYHQFNIQELYALPTLYLCVLCLSENKQRLMPLTA